MQPVGLYFLYKTFKVVYASVYYNYCMQSQILNVALATPFQTKP